VFDCFDTHFCELLIQMGMSHLKIISEPAGKRSSILRYYSLQPSLYTK